MQILSTHPELEMLGINNLENIYWQLNTAQLYEQAVRRHEGIVAHLGPLSVRTGNHIHHSARDSFIVREASTQQDIAWGDTHHPFDPMKFDQLYQKMLAYIRGGSVFVENMWVGADKNYRLPIRVITETAWHSLFVRDMFFIPLDDELETFLPDFTVLHVPSFRAMPEVDGTFSDVFVVINFAKRLILIGGTAYAGEIKKALFAVMGYILPHKGVLPMRAAANKTSDGEVTLFLGRSQTGKTTLATDDETILIADDEVAWTDRGIFSLERGGYANITKISSTLEAEIFHTTRRFGTILENFPINTVNRRIDLTQPTFTTNARAIYPLTHIFNAIPELGVDHPRNIILLTNDMSGVLPPVAKLTREQAIYHFRAGYNSRLINGKLHANFSAGFDELMLPLHPGHYASMFEKQLQKYKIDTWLVNTGLTGGGYGVGERIKIGFTKLIVKAITDGSLAKMDFVQAPVFGLSIPVRCPGVFEGLLNPRETWYDKDAYDRAAQELHHAFDVELEEYYSLALEG